MIDLVELLVIAGDGGNGRISFHREKFVTKGGPDGGNGGKGGDVWLRATKKLASLQQLAGVKKIQAKSGQLGGRRKQFGAKAADVIIEVPLGTRVWLKEENVLQDRRKQYHVTKETDSIPADFGHTDLVPVESLSLTASPLTQTPALLASELLEDGQEYLLCRGGEGGRGNVAFARSTRTTPLVAEYGTPGQRRLIELELRLLADIGFVGFPSVGKSTLLSVLTRSKPKIAAYPFTTLEPHLGILHLNTHRSLVLADIPGLIAGASQGKGLGATFLRHISHCQALCFVLAIPEDVLSQVAETLHQTGENMSPTAIEQVISTVEDQYQVLQQELQASYPELLDRPTLVVLNKIDIYPDQLSSAIQKHFGSQRLPFMAISAATQVGIETLKQKLGQLTEIS